MATLVDDAQSTNFTTALGGAAPVANDTVLVRRWEHTYLAGADFGTIDLLKFHWRKDSRVNFDDLKLRANQGGTGQVILEGGGQRMRLACDLAASVIAKLVLKPVRSDFQLNHSVGTVTLAEQENGIWNVADTIAAATARISGGRAIFNESANALTTLEVSNEGDVSLYRDVGTINHKSGTTRLLHSSVTPGTINMDGGLMEYFLAGASAGTLNGNAGTIDFRNVGADITFAGGTLKRGLTLIFPIGITVDISACTDQGCKKFYS